MLRAIHISWKEDTMKIRLYVNIPPLTHILHIRKIRLAGHCYRSGKNMFYYGRRTMEQQSLNG